MLGSFGATRTSSAHTVWRGGGFFPAGCHHQAENPMCLMQVETSLFQWPRRGAMCAGVLYQLGTLIWVPWMGAASCHALGSQGQAPFPLWQRYLEAHHPLPAGSRETSPPPLCPRTLRQILSPFPATMTSPRASVSVIGRDRERRNEVSPSHTASPGPHSSGLGRGYQLNNWDKTLSPAIGASTSLLHASPARVKPMTHERMALSL